MGKHTIHRTHRYIPCHRIDHFSYTIFVHTSLLLESKLIDIDGLVKQSIWPTAPITYILYLMCQIIGQREMWLECVISLTLCNNNNNYPSSSHVHHQWLYIPFLFPPCETWPTFNSLWCLQFIRLYFISLYIILIR